MRKQKIIGLIGKELAILKQCKKMLRGTVYLVQRKKKNGAVYEGYQLTYKGESNITKTIYISIDKLPEAKKLIQNYQIAKKAFNRIIELNIELFKAV